MRIVSDFSSGNMLAEIEEGYEYPASLGGTKKVKEHGLYTFTEATGVVEHDDGNRSFTWVGPIMEIETAVYDPADNILAITVAGKLYRMNLKQGETFESLSDFASDGEFIERG